MNMLFHTAWNLALIAFSVTAMLICDLKPIEIVFVVIISIAASISALLVCARFH